MTVASKITLGRLLLVPVFVILAIYYSRTVAAGEPAEALRWWAVATFVTAAVSDGLDGFIARRFNQRSSFGAMIDPIADKALLLAGLITLASVEWGPSGWKIPAWFLVLAIARDIFILGGLLVLYVATGRFPPIRPHWTSKICTAAQMILLAWVMLKLIPLSPLYPTIVAAVFTIWSGWAYFRLGLTYLSPEHHRPQ